MVGIAAHALRLMNLILPSAPPVDADAVSSRALITADFGQKC
jgi:hypothetical protein